MRRIDVPVPGLSDQRQVVDEIERRLSLVEATESNCEQQVLRAKGLRRSILTAAFTGDLVKEAAA
jgi:type I restriction enzyme S subunit